MAVSAFIMCFTILLKAVCSQTKPTAMVSSHYVATLTEYADVSTCEWNCVISSTDFSKEMKKLVTERKMVTLDVQYDEKVDQICSDQSYTKTLSKPESWIWLASACGSKPKQSSSYSTSVPKPLEDNILLESTEEGYKEVNVSCGFEPVTRDAQDNPPGSFDNRLIALLLIQGIANSSKDLHNFGSLCYAETKHNPYICLNISKTGNISETELDFGYKMLRFAVIFTEVFISIVIGLYAPAILCLFPVTEVTDRHGVRQIILEGPGPVGLRRLVAKYFHSENEPIWRGVKHFLLRIAIIPLLLLIPSGGPLLRLSSELQLLYICYGIRAFFLSFLPTKSFRKKRCIVCRFVRHEARFHQGELLKEIRDHLGVQTLLFQECRKLFTRNLFRYVKLTCRFLPSPKASILNLFQGLLFISLVVIIPLITIILIIWSISVFISLFFVATPISSIGSVKWFVGYIISKNKGYFHYIFIEVPLFVIESFLILLAFLGGLLLFGTAALDVGIASLYALLIFVERSTDSLPYVTCSVIVLYYLWSCYSSFTKQYRNLALTLYKQFKRSCNQLPQSQDLESETEPTHCNVNTEKIMRIPKDLFDIACVELLPVGQSVCVMLVKVAFILVFFFLVFLTIMAVPDVTSTTKAMVTFFTGAFPKLLSIFLDGSKNKTLNDVALEEKVSCIVKDYVARSWTLDEVDDEEELVLTNPDSTELNNFAIAF